MITIYFSILDKLETYCVEHFGFEHKVPGLKKVLSVEEYTISPTVLENIIKRKVAPFRPVHTVLEEVLVENYVTDVVMEKAIAEIDWTDEERAFFTCQNDDDEAEAERAYQGWADMEGWIFLQDITVDRKELDEYIKNAKLKTKKRG